MAFVQLERWQIAPDTRMILPNRFGSNLWPGLTPTSGVPHRLVALIASAVVHCLLLAVMAKYMLNTESAVPAGNRPDITVLELPGLRPDTSESPQTRKAVDSALAPAEATPSEATSSSKPEAAKPEWAIVQLPAVRATMPTAALSKPLATPGSQIRTASTSASVEGGPAGAGYDPYAGAAPTRLGMDAHNIFARRETAVLPVAANDDSAVDEKALKKIRRNILRMQPRLSGTADIILTLEANGRVMVAQVVGGSVDTSFYPVIERMLLGARLLRPARKAAGKRTGAVQLVFP